MPESGISRCDGVKSFSGFGGGSYKPPKQILRSTCFLTVIEDLPDSNATDSFPMVALTGVDTPIWNGHSSVNVSELIEFHRFGNDVFILFYWHAADYSFSFVRIQRNSSK
jgi:hypothetical protein